MKNVLLAALPAAAISLSVVACSSTSGVSASGITGAIGAPPDSSVVYGIARIVMATENTEGMAQFYDRVFGARFKRVSGYDTFVYEGNLFGLEYVLIPNAAVGARCERSRHEFNISVKDLDATLQRVVATGGVIAKNPTISDRRRAATVIDPDGNTMILTESP